MKKTTGMILVGIVLAGCASGAEERERADDEMCRRVVAERQDPNPNAYEICRQGTSSYHTERAIRSGR